MTKNKIDYSGQQFSPNRLPAAYDFSQSDVINNPYKTEIEEEAGVVLVDYTANKTHPYKSKPHTGTFQSQYDLKQILNKQIKDESFYIILDAIKKNDKVTYGLVEDFSLLRDFFTTNVINEVLDYTSHIIPKITRILKKEGTNNLTPRKRRGIILAIFKSISRKNGRKFTQQLLDEINARFNYQRKIKLFEISKWENKLLKHKLLIRTEDFTKDRLKNFFYHVVTHSQQLKRHSAIQANKKYVKLVDMTKQHIMAFAREESTRQIVVEMTKHVDIDFLSRLIIWTIAKNYAKEEYQLDFKDSSELDGWRSLFLVDSNNDSELSIRSWKYIFWREFSFRKELLDNGLL
jgi:hypothetical protein